MKQLLSVLIIMVSIILGSGVCFAFDQEKSPIIIVSSDINHALAAILVEGTDIQIVDSIPDGYAPEAHGQYLKKNYTEFSALAKEADIVLTSTSSWPSDPLYPWARRANIRINHIDTTAPLDRSRAGIPLLALPDGSLAPNAWMSPGNFARMADIVTMDLAKFYPQQESIFQNNLDLLKNEMFQLRSYYESLMSDLEAFEVIVLTNEYLYFLDEFGLMVTSFMLKPEIRWTEKELESLAKEIIANEIKGVICAWEPKENIAKVIAANGAQTIVLKSFKLTEESDFDQQLYRYYRENLQSLVKGLADVKK